tara:strand:- start:102 stop:317 length:216 start_codon:yes stop_codon:yes gene_type:complete
MAKDRSATIVIDDVEYSQDDMTESQQRLLAHVIDLDRKLNRSRFQVDQLSVGRETFMSALRDSLAVEEPAG